MVFYFYICRCWKVFNELANGKQVQNSLSLSVHFIFIPLTLSEPVIAIAITIIIIIIIAVVAVVGHSHSSSSSACCYYYYYFHKAWNNNAKNRKSPVLRSTNQRKARWTVSSRCIEQVKANKMRARPKLTKQAKVKTTAELGKGRSQTQLCLLLNTICLALLCSALYLCLSLWRASCFEEANHKLQIELERHKSKKMSIC